VFPDIEIKPRSRYQGTIDFKEDLMTSSTPSNAPMLPAGSPPLIRTWINAVTKPNEQTFAAIAVEPGAGAGKAFLWVFVASLVSGFCASLVQGVAMRNLMEQLNQNGGNFDLGQAGGGGGFVGALCGAPVAAVVSVLTFAIAVGLVQWVAKLFGGQGDFNQLAYAFSAFSVPLNLFSAVMVLLGAVPMVGFCFSLLSFGVFLYSIFLAVTATKGVNRLGWGAAAGSVLIPAAVLIGLCLCLLFALAALLGPAIGNVFSTINQSLTP
jgi:hypothetical protein